MTLNNLDIKLKRGALTVIVFASAFAGVALAIRLASYEDVSWVWPIIVVWLSAFSIYLRKQI